MENRREITPEYTLLVSAIKKMAGNKELLRRMDEVPRYEKYFTGGGKKIWDMDERGHAINTNKIVARLGSEDLRAGRLSQEEFDQLRIAALVHDLGEIEVGDISYDEKRTEDETAEKKSFEKNLPLYFPGLSEEERVLILKIYHEITQNKDRAEKLTRYFNLVERIGYLSNAIEVFQKRPENINWQWLIGNVLHNQGGHLLIYLGEYESAKRYLTENKTVIQEMLAWADKHRAESRDLKDEDAATWKKLLSLVE